MARDGGEFRITFSAVDAQRITEAFQKFGEALAECVLRIREFANTTRRLATEWDHFGEYHELPVCEHFDQRDTERSYDLLLEWLTPEQRATWDKHHCFNVTGSRSGREYIIRDRQNFNVVWDAGDHFNVLICFGPQFVPLGDQLLAQKLILEGNEDAALAVANWTVVQSLEFRCCEGKYAQAWREVLAFGSETKSPLDYRSRLGCPLVPMQRLSDVVLYRCSEGVRVVDRVIRLVP